MFNKMKTLEVDGIAHFFLATKLCVFTRVKPMYQNCSKFKLSTDTEKNHGHGPRPLYVDLSKTVAAPYS